jgi:hypothetical protein
MKQKAHARRARMQGLVLGVLLFCLGEGLVFSPAAQAAPTLEEQQQIENAGTKKRELEAEQKRTQEMIGRLSALKTDTSAYIAGLDQDMTALETEISGLEAKGADKEAEIGVTEEELSAKQADRKKQYEEMKLRIRYMYEKGNTGFVELLFSSGNLSEFFNRVEYVQKISEYDRRQLDRYGQLCEETEQKKQQLLKEREELLELQASAEAKRNATEALMREKRRELEQYAGEIGEAQDELSAYQAQIAAQEAEIRAVEAAVKKREEEQRKAEEEARRRQGEAQEKPKSIGDLHFLWPCPGSARVTSPFGKRTSPVKGASSYHQGIDIAAATGTVIVAAAEGEVVTASYTGAAGNFIMLSHGGGVYTLYMHCSEIDVSVGQRVTAGETIGRVGSTGISTGPHLHFGLRSGGNYLDPASYVRP